MKNTTLYLKRIESFEIEDFTTFHANRLLFMNDKLFIDQYNREVEIGNTGEDLQVCYFIILHKLFLRKFEKSPMILNTENKSVTIKGKVYFTNSGFELEENQNDFLKKI